MLEWLHQGCDGALAEDFLHYGVGDFPCRKLSQVIQIRLFFASARKSGSGNAISAAFMYIEASLCKNFSVYIKTICVKLALRASV